MEGKLKRIVWDLETVKTLEELGLDESKEGWAIYRKTAGVSWGVLYDIEASQFHHFAPCMHIVEHHEEGEPVQLDLEVINYDPLLSMVMMLESADEVIGYNTRGFDRPLLENIFERPLRLHREVDLMRIIFDHVGFGWPKGSWKLDRVCDDTINMRKMGEGAHAPGLVKEGRWAELATYCQQDTWITFKLWEHLREQKYVTAPDGRKIPIRNEVLVA